MKQGLGFGELAQMYFPAATDKASARRMFCRWIKNNPTLAALQSNIKGTRHYTPQELEVFYQILGEP